MSYYIALGVGSLISLAFCIKRANGFSVSNLLFKAISSLCFILTAALALFENSDALTYGSLIIFGGVLGLCGDITLDLKGIYKQDENVYLRSGFIFFLIGHIFYSTAIILSIDIKLWQILACCVASVVVGILNNVSAKITNLKFGAYKGIVFCYVVFLSFTMLLSIAASILSGFEKKYVLLMIGAILFTLSDVVLSSTYFGEGKDGKFYYFINHLLYYAGQYLIASSIMFM